MKYHNVFIRIAILEYARLYISSLKDENTIMQTVDSIVSLKPRNDLNLGDGLGQFKVEHNNEPFIWKTDAVKKWYYEDTKKTGLKDSRKSGNFYLIKPPFRLDYNTLRIVKQKEEWSRLWPELD